MGKYLELYEKIKRLSDADQIAEVLADFLVGGTTFDPVLRSFERLPEEDLVENPIERNEALELMGGLFAQDRKKGKVVADKVIVRFFEKMAEIKAQAYLETGMEDPDPIGPEEWAGAWKGMFVDP